MSTLRERIVAVTVAREMLTGKPGAFVAAQGPGVVDVITLANWLLLDTEPEQVETITVSTMDGTTVLEIPVELHPDEGAALRDHA